MTFGEKVKKARKELGLTQTELGNLIGVSRRAITAYEADMAAPRTKDTYYKLADALKVAVNYLLTEGDVFVLDIGEKYGPRDKKDAKGLVEELTGLFSGGHMAEEDMDELMLAIQKAYVIAKENTRKYVPKKYRIKSESSETGM
jgi:transcriptional regulator with XRE-family HTH domain